MADFERTVLEFYQLPTPYPSEWPAERDEADAGEDTTAANPENRRLSRYQALATAVNERRSMMSGPDGGVNNLVQKDEADPLGSTDSVVRSLKQMGLPIQDDPRLRKHISRNNTRHGKCLTNDFTSQAIDSYFRPQHSLPLYIYPKCMPMPTRETCCRD